MTGVNMRPATDRLGDVIRGVRDDQLTNVTPSDCTVGQLLDHVQSFGRAFAAAAAKLDNEVTAGPPPAPDAARLGAGWRERIPRELDELTAAWTVTAAWEGMTRVGGLSMPGEAAGVVALDEVVLHGWDLAVATEQPYELPSDVLAALVPFLEHVAEPGMEAARVGLFGPVVPVPDDAGLFDRILCLAGRDPRWSSD